MSIFTGIAQKVKSWVSQANEKPVSTLLQITTPYGLTGFVAGGKTQEVTKKVTNIAVSVGTPVAGAIFGGVPGAIAGSAAGTAAGGLMYLEETPKTSKVAQKAEEYGISGSKQLIKVATENPVETALLLGAVPVGVLAGTKLFGNASKSAAAAYGGQSALDNAEEAMQEYYKNMDKINKKTTDDTIKAAEIAAKAEEKRLEQERKYQENLLNMQEKEAKRQAKLQEKAYELQLKQLEAQQKAAQQPAVVATSTTTKPKKKRKKSTKKKAKSHKKAKKKTTKKYKKRKAR